MDWDKLRIFHAVAEAGSFTHAAETLNLSQSAISRQISSLEGSLNVPLFHRHARGLILTEQGELLFRTASEVFTRLPSTESRIRESKERPQGSLRVTTTVAFGSVWLTPRIKEFNDHYPEIALSLVLDDSELDLGMREADVAIRMVPPRQPNLVQRHLITLHYHIYATPAYLRKHGMPKTPSDLDAHQIIVMCIHVTAGTAPGSVPRTFAQTGAHWVALDISAQTGEVTLFLYQTTLEPTLPKSPGATMLLAPVAAV